MNETNALTKQRIVSELSRSAHGALSAYVPVGVRAAVEETDFFAHLIAWNEIKGQVRDSKVALPILALSAPVNGEYQENALAHVAKLDPRNLVRAVRFSMSVSQLKGRKRVIRRLVERYLRIREERWGWWERTALSHRSSMKELYALNHVKPSAMANAILFKNDYPAGTVFSMVKQLPTMSDDQAARVIVDERLPFLVVSGALGARAKSEPLLLAMLGQMTAPQVVTNAALLEKLGVKSTPALRAAFEQAMARVVESKSVTLKTSKAAKAVKDEKLAERLDAVQEKQINTLGGIEGDWLILADRSGSMQSAIGAAKEIAGFLSRAAKGIVSLIYFDNSPMYYDATGKTLEEIKTMTRSVAPGGSTSVGVGLRYAIEKGLQFGGIVIVSDGGENSPPFFPSVYAAARKKDGSEPPVYFYRVDGEKNVLGGEMNHHGIEFQQFDIEGSDFYSLPNMMQTMRTNRYSLVDEILATPLLTLDEVFQKSAE